MKTPPVYSLPAESRATARIVALSRPSPRGACTSKVKVSRSSSPTSRNAWGRTAGQPSGTSRPTVPVVVSRAPWVSVTVKRRLPGERTDHT